MNSGFVTFTKTEWDEMNYFDSLFLLMNESETRKEEMRKYNKKRGNTKRWG